MIKEKICYLHSPYFKQDNINSSISGMYAEAFREKYILKHTRHKMMMNRWMRGG